MQYKQDEISMQYSNTLLFTMFIAYKLTSNGLYFRNLLHLEKYFRFYDKNKSNADIPELFL